MKNYVIMNTKATGLLHPFDDTTLVKIEAVKLDKDLNEQERFLEYIKLKEDLDKDQEELLGITNDILKEKGIPLKEALEKFLEFTKNSWLMSYNADFDISFLLKGIYETQIKDHAINFISLKEYIKYKTEICKKTKSTNLGNIANYYHIKYSDLEKDWISVTINLLKKLMEEEEAKTIEEFTTKNIPQILLPGLSKKDTKVKVKFHHGKGENARRSIEFFDKTPDRKVSYLTMYNAIHRYDTTFYELVLFRKWGAQTVDDLIYLNKDTLEFFDYYSIDSTIDLAVDKELKEKIEDKICYLEHYQVKLGCIGTIEELKKNYKALGKENLNKLIDHIKIFGHNKKIINKGVDEK